jgi:predicted permease
MPCAIIGSFEIDFTKEKLQGLLFSAVIAVIIHVLLLIFINIGRKFWHWTPVECATVMYSNSGNMIIPLVSAILGSDYVLYSCAFMSVQLIFLWTHCSTMLSEKPHLEWKKIISNINVLAIIAGLLLFFCKIKLPAVILAPINDIGNMLAPLSMIVTGMLMADSPILASLKNAKLYLFSAIRLVIWPTILLLIMCVSHVYEFIPDGRTLLLIVYLASITPSASTITQMVQVYNKDATYSSLLNVFTTLFCIITMPLAVILFSWLIL